MPTVEKIYTVREFEDITRDGIKEPAFGQLRRIILSDGEPDGAVADELIVNASACMKLHARGGTEAVRVKNYVGIIALPCGLTIEILPKISFGDDATARKLVLEMLRACGKIPYKHFQNADLNAEKFNLMEIFIRMFIDEVTRLYKRGFASGYVYTESNERFIKGKLLVSDNIKRNFAHRERFCVGYDEFELNRPENRLIKSALVYLRGRSVSDENKRELNRLCLMLDGIDASDNIERDFARCSGERNVKHYAYALKLCRVFLRKKSFTLYGGDNSAASLLFPMETLYERYIAREMEKALPPDWRLTAQSRGKYLFDVGGFALRPDIMLENKKDGARIIIDTKWKKLNSDRLSNYGISQADMYQMYAYHTRFANVKKVILLYPLHDRIEIPDYVVHEPKVTVAVRFFDLKKYTEKKCGFFDCFAPNTKKTV